MLFLGVDEPKCSGILKEMRLVEVPSRCRWGLEEVKRGEELKWDKVKGSEFTFFNRVGEKRDRAQVHSLWTSASFRPFPGLANILEAFC